MQWAALAIVAIAVVVWILSTIFGGQNPPPSPPLRRRPEQFDNPPPQRRPPIRVARPVDESRRREPPVRRPTTPEPKRPIIVLEEVKEPTQTSLEATRAGYTPTQSPSKPLIQKPFSAPSSPVSAQPQSSLEATRAEYAPTQSPSQLPVAEVAKPLPASPTLRQVRELLRSPQSAAAAFVLREILDAPRCRRPR